MEDIAHRHDQREQYDHHRLNDQSDDIIERFSFLLTMLMTMQVDY